MIDGSESGANATVEAQTEVALNFDPDATKGNAFGLIFGMPAIDDRLDFEHGDKEDWRYIIVAEPGVMSITLSLDTPAKINGGWNIYDSEERALHRQSFSQGQNYYEFPSFPVKPGIYYFETYAMSGASIYTLGTSFSPREPDPVVEPEVEEEVEEVKPAKHHTKKQKTEVADEAPAPKPSKPAKTEDAGTKVVGFIALITPKDDGTAEVTIRDAGKNKGVEAGAIGKLEGTGTKIEMTTCLATSCRAVLPKSVNIKSLKQGANVIFYIK